MNREARKKNGSSLFGGEPMFPEAGKAIESGIINYYTFVVEISHFGQCYEALFGKTFVTGEKVNIIGRAMAALNAIPFTKVEGLAGKLASGAIKVELLFTTKKGVENYVISGMTQKEAKTLAKQWVRGGGGNKSNY